MKPKILVRIIAVLYMVWGFYKVVAGLFLQPDGTQNIAWIIWGIVIFRAGDNLLQYKQAGRIMMLVISFLSLGWNLLILLLLIGSQYFLSDYLMITPNSFYRSIEVWAYYIFSSLYQLLMILFFFKETTKEIFLPVIPISAIQPVPESH